MLHPNLPSTMDKGASPLPPQPPGVREHGTPPPQPPPLPPPMKRGITKLVLPSGHARRKRCLPLDPMYGSNPEKFGLLSQIDLRRALNLEIMLTKLHMPLAVVLALDETVLDVDQIENLIKFCPTKVEMELLEVFASQKLKEVMKEIMYLENTLINQENTINAAAVGFKLKSFLKLKNTHGTNSNMSLMHYLCKELAAKAPVLLDFYKDLESLESASEITLESLVKKMQAIDKGLNKVEKELVASESDGPVSEVFRKGRKVDALLVYFGENPNRCPFEQVIRTLFSFINSFKKAHEDNIKQELENEKASKEVLALNS
ncbi:unnamed protein product [Eruca vesicaria subsp. sativa]|uniref:FH2 domain-containing protein n=1 Tax=Eruca vesicaria subsp. sativa TaxID=29727 RepID=A0ABC8LXF0_ERUVS|nr:unnamed protein product [Eruca vesicaria subsp. sativa]